MIPPKLALRTSLKMPPKSKQPPKVGQKIVNKKGSQPAGDVFQDSKRLRREGFLKPPPLRTDLDQGEFYH